MVGAELRTAQLCPFCQISSRLIRASRRLLCTIVHRNYLKAQMRRTNLDRPLSAAARTPGRRDAWLP